MKVLCSCWIFVLIIDIIWSKSANYHYDHRDEYQGKHHNYDAHDASNDYHKPHYYMPEDYKASYDSNSHYPNVHNSRKIYKRSVDESIGSVTTAALEEVDRGRFGEFDVRGRCIDVFKKIGWLRSADESIGSATTVSLEEVDRGRFVEFDVRGRCIDVFKKIGWLRSVDESIGSAITVAPDEVKGSAGGERGGLDRLDEPNDKTLAPGSLLCKGTCVNGLCVTEETHEGERKPQAPHHCAALGESERKNSQGPGRLDRVDVRRGCIKVFHSRRGDMHIDHLERGRIRICGDRRHGSSNHEDSPVDLEEVEGNLVEEDGKSQPRPVSFGEFDVRGRCIHVFDSRLRPVKIVRIGRRHTRICSECPPGHLCIDTDFVHDVDAIF